VNVADCKEACNYTYRKGKRDGMLEAAQLVCKRNCATELEAIRYESEHDVEWIHDAATEDGEGGSVCYAAPLWEELGGES